MDCTHCGHPVEEVDRDWETVDGAPITVKVFRCGTCKVDWINMPAGDSHGSWLPWSGRGSPAEDALARMSEDAEESGLYEAG